ncbi:MAG: hypothetical protein EA379_12565 [Phycisphaerales bacterium]|nr:MAG: hypothetical protein EA379_12565 [Phycisphaerales bacterium]
MNIAKSLLALAAGLATACAAHAGATIAELAPRHTLFAAGVDSVAGARAAFERTTLHDLWKNERVRAFVIATVKESAIDTSDINDVLAEFLDTDDVPLPGGALGFAYFLDEPDRPNADEPFVAHFLFVADYADDANADEAWEAIDDAIERAAARRALERTPSEHAGVEITTIRPDYERLDEMAGREEDDDTPWWERKPTLVERDLPKAFHIARVGGAMIVCTSAMRLHDAIDRLEGVDAGPTLRDNEDYTRALAQLPAGASAHAAFLLRASREAMQGFDDDAVGNILYSAIPGLWMLTDSLGPMMDALGLNELLAASAGLRLDTPDAAAELSYAALVPTKRGALSLLDVPARPFTLPAFVGPDATGVSLMRIDFPAIPRIVREVVMAMPEDERDEMMGQLEFVLQQAEPLLGALGGELMTVERVERPFSADSKRAFYAIPTNEPQTFIHALGMLGQLIGLAPRDFQGNQIWEAEFPPVTVGIGFGHVFIGDTPSVESAMRQAGAADVPTLGAEERFTRAVRSLGREGTFFTYSDTRTAVEYAAWVAANMDSVFLERIRAMGFEREMDPETYDRILRSMRESQPKSLELFPPAEDIVRHLGDTAAEVRPTDDGFAGRWLLLHPQR